MILSNRDRRKANFLAIGVCDLRLIKWSELSEGELHAITNAIDLAADWLKIESIVQVNADLVAINAGDFAGNLSTYERVASTVDIKINVELIIIDGLTIHPQKNGLTLRSLLLKILLLTDVLHSKK